MSLYDIDRETKYLMEEIEMIAEANEGEFPDFLNAKLDDLNQERDIKIGNVCKVIKNLSAEVLAIKNEAKNLTDRAKTIENRKNWLIKYLKESLKSETFSDNNTKVSYRNNPYVHIPDTLDMTEQNDRWIKTKLDWDKLELKKAIKLGETVPEGITIKINKSIQIK